MGAKAGGAGSDRPTRLRVPAWALGLALVVGTGAGLRGARAAHPGAFLSTDERGYATLAIGLVHGHYGGPHMVDPLHWAPGTPMLFAVTRIVAGAGDDRLDPPALFWAQALVGVALIVAVFALVAMLAGPRWGVVGAAVVALYPPLVSATGDLVSEPLGALTLAVAMAVLVWCLPRRSIGRFALAGVATGAAMLVRPDLLLLAPALAPVIALCLAGAGRRVAATSAIAFVAGAVLAVSPWSVFATTRRDTFTPLTSGSWSTLFVGTYLPADGRPSRVREALADETRAHNPALAGVPDHRLRLEWVMDAVAARHPRLSRDAALRRETLHNLRAYALGRPPAFAGMQARKVAHLWLDYSRGSTHARRGWILAVHLAVVGLGMAGLIQGLRRAPHPALWILLAAMLTLTAVNAFFVAQPRHNSRIVPLVVAAGAAGWGRWAAHRRAGEQAPATSR